jgi:ABC transport system ATP-binding/permease protein
MTNDGAGSSNGPALVVRTQGFDRSLQAGPAYKIGRNPASDIVVNDSRVSWQHAVLRLEHENWLLEDSGSTNGTFLDSRRVQRVPITGECTLRLGHPDDGPVLSCSVAPPVAPAVGPMGTAMVNRPGPPPPQAGPGPAAPVQHPPAQAPPAPARPWEQPAPPPPAQAPPARAWEQPAPPPPAQAPPAPARSWEQPAHDQPAAASPPPSWGPPAAPAQEPPAASWSPADAARGAAAPPARELDGQTRGYDPFAPNVPAGAPSSSIIRQPSAIMRLPTRVLRIGRAADNDVVVDDLSVSRHHAELRNSARGYQIVDLDSHNGTFVNGARVSGAIVTERDIVSIGPATFRLVGDELQQFIDSGDISLQARDLTVQLSSGKVLLDHISFPLAERCLLGVIGPSGAGKSTLLGALTGIAPAGQGAVLYDNRDLYAYYDELRYRIGLVPQQEILHTQLSARKALGYAAELRFPRDTSKAERQHRITEVLEELSLTKHAETKTSALSGGQQKRVNVAMELLTKPSLLFLDEPTSGLDPGLDKSVMELMADLAHDGRTVIVVTHSVANLNLCDRLLVLVPGGKIGYFGPPGDALKHFRQPGWAEVFQAFDADPGRDWAGEYRRSPYHAMYVASEMDGQAAVAQPAQTTAPPAARNRFAQLSTLCRRYLAVIASDKVFLAVLAALPLFLGILIRIIPSPLGLRGPGNTDIGTLLLILILSTCFTGAANSVRELVKERVIYSRERAAGLSSGAYLLSKLIILAILSALQAALLVVVGLIGRKMPLTGSFLTHLPLVELLIALAALAAASMTLGLLISAMVSTSERTMPLLVVIVLFQVVLTGGIFALNGKAGIEQVAWLSPSRWGFAAAASTTNLNVIQFPAGTKAAANPPPASPATKATPHRRRHHAGATPGATPAASTAATPSASATATTTAKRSTTAMRSTTARRSTVAKGRTEGTGAADRTGVAAGTAVKASTSLSASASSSASASPSGSPSPSASASPSASGSPGPGSSSGSPALTTDPLWKHNASTWLIDVGMMLVLGLVFSLIAWWRLLRLGPSRRR